MKKFRNNPSVMAANGASLRAGYNFADTAELFSVQHTVAAARLPKGRYRRVTGNEAAALGLVAAAHRAGRTLVYASYPITPASEILHELSKYKEYDVRTLQTEDEIAACVRRHRRVVRRSDRSDRHQRAGPLVEGRSPGPGRDDRTAAGGHRRAAGRAEHRHAHQDGTGRSADGHVRPARRVSAGGAGRGHARRLLSRWRSRRSGWPIKYMTPVMLLSDSFLANSAEPWRIVNPDDLPDLRTRRDARRGGVRSLSPRSGNLVAALGRSGNAGMRAPHRRPGKGRRHGSGQLRRGQPSADGLAAEPEDRTHCPRYSPGEGRGTGGGRSAGGRLGQHLRRDCRRRRRSAAGRATGRTPALALLESLPRQSGLDPRELQAHPGSGKQHGATPPHAPRPVPRGRPSGCARSKAGRSASGRFRSESNNCWENNRDDELRTRRLRCRACRRDASAR